MLDEKLDKIIELLEGIKANQPVPYYYYPQIVYYPPGYYPPPYYPPTPWETSGGT